MRRVLALPLVLAAAPLFSAEFFVAPNGGAGSSGSFGDPWSLTFALSHPSVLRPGDTVWLRGGSYGQFDAPVESNLNGTLQQPVVLRQYPGERATLLGGLKFNGSYTTYWGFEVFEPASSSAETASGSGNRLVHLVVHSAAPSSRLLDQPGLDSFGCLWYEADGTPHFTDRGQLSPFDRGRANVEARFNMRTGQLELDPGDLLSPGTPFELYDANSPFGPPILRGVYGDRPIVISESAEDRQPRLLILMPGRKSLAERAATVAFLGIDTTTKGAWRGAYGQDGNYIANHSYAYAPYSYPATNAPGIVLLSDTSADVRGLQRYVGDPSQRVLSYAHTYTTMDWILPATDGLTHRVAFYFCDFENYGRSIGVDLLDTATQQLLDTRSLTTFNNGVYLVYNYTGSITLRVRNNLNGTQARTASAPLSAILWGGTGVPVVDTTPPLVSITAPAAAATVLGTVALQANASDNVAVSSVQFLVDNLPFGSPIATAPYSINWNTTGVANGTHTISAVARDTSNLTTTTAITVTVNNPPPDTTLPTVSITNPVPGTVNGIVNITVNATDNIAMAGVQLKLDGINLGAEIPGAGPTFTFPWNTALTTNAAHTISAVARDTSNNLNTATVTITVNNPDTTPPSVSILTPAAGGVAGLVNISANASDNVAVAGVQFRIDGNPIGSEIAAPPYAISWNSTSVPDGAHTISATARDTANLTTTVTITVTVNNSSSTFVTFLGRDDSTQGNWKGVYGQDGNFLVQHSYLAPSYSFFNPINVNQYVFDIWSTDPRALLKTFPQYSQNERIMSHFYNRDYFEIQVSTNDNQPHRVALYFCDYDLRNRTITVSARDTNTGTVFDTRILNSYTNGVYFVYNYRGPVTFKIKNNYSGAVTEPNGTLSGMFWGGSGLGGTPDTTPPTVSIVSPAAGANLSSVLTVNVNATDNVNVAGVQLKLDGANLGAELTGAGPAYSFSWNTVGVANGPHTLSAVARDAANNTSTATVNVTLNNIVDTVPPTVGFTTVSSGATLSGSPLLQATANDNVGVVDVTYLLDGSTILGAPIAASPYSFVWNTTGVANGAHTLTARARDAAGLTGVSTINITVNNQASTFVTFLGQDLNTKGNWKGVYGQDGIFIVQDSYLYPAYSVFNPRNVGLITLGGYSTDVRALQKNVGTPTDRIAAYCYGSPTADFDMRSTDNQTHRVALYFADFENAGRSITIEARDQATNALLDSRALTNYTGGVYMIYNYKGPVTFRMINNLTGAGTYPTISAVFWGGAGIP